MLLFLKKNISFIVIFDVKNLVKINNWDCLSPQSAAAPFASETDSKVVLESFFCYFR